MEHLINETEFVLQQLQRTKKRTPLFWTVYYQMNQQDLRFPTSYLPETEKEEIRKRTQRQRLKDELEQEIIRQQRRATALRSLYSILKSRPISYAFTKSSWKALDIIREFLSSNPSMMSAGYKDRVYYFGKYLDRKEKQWLRVSATMAKPMKDKLPLYACSGELEFSSIWGMKRDRIKARSMVSTFVRERMDIGRDGGGQFETRFTIDGSLPSVACGLVQRLGSTRRNGGHIHLNCKGNPVTGERVYNGLRYHLTWMRWLSPYHRRAGRFSSVAATRATFEEAQRHKFAALSANTWGRTGTVEMRLWGSTKRASEWVNRAELMKSIARWTETATVPVGFPITKDNGRFAFVTFYRYAVTAAPDVLRYVLKELKKVARYPQRDRVAAEEAHRLLVSFDNSGLALRGYRRERMGVDVSTLPESPDNA
jgi:hypothetical protein